MTECTSVPIRDTCWASSTRRGGRHMPCRSRSAQGRRVQGITNLLTYSSDVAWGTQRMSWRTLRELSVKLETMTELSEDVVKSEALLPRLALLIYRYDGTPQTPGDTLYTLCP